ncbi:MAG: S8 family serine peptidase [Saprospiraceae bacterium]
MRLILLLILTLSLNAIGSVYAQSTNNRVTATSYLIQIQPGLSIEQWKRECTRQIPALENAEFALISKQLNIYTVKIDRTESSWLVLIRKMPMTRSAGYDAKLDYRKKEPNDPFYGDQWHLNLIQAPEVWEVSTGGKDINGDDIVIAIVDEGYDTSHVDLRPNFYRNVGEIPNDGIDNDLNGYKDDYLGYNVITQNDQHEKVYHGTAVAGLCGARGNNDSGITGVSWESKILLMSGASLTSQALACYDYILNMRRTWNLTSGAKGIHIVLTNSSFGKDDAFPEDFPGWCEFYDAMGAEGILSVASTANNDVDVDIQGDLPTTCQSEYLLTVTNTTRTDTKEQFAGYGKKNIDIGSPGEDVLSTTINNGYANFAGTSASAPVATGAAAILFGIPSPGMGALLLSDPAQVALTIKQAIIDGVDRIPGLEEITVSNGRLNVLKALQLLQAQFGVAPGDLEITNLSPNPVREQIEITYQTNNYDAHEFMIVNELGQVMMTKTLKPSRWEAEKPRFDTTPLANGIYFVMVRRGKKVSSRPFVKY